MSYFAFSGSLAKRFSIPISPEEVPEPPPPGGYQDIVDAPDGGAPPIAHLRLASIASIVDRKGLLTAGTFAGTGQALVAGLPADSDEAVDFGGAASGSIPHHASLELAAFSLSFWFRTPTLPSETTVWHIFSKEQSGFTAGDFFVRIDSGGGLTINFQSSDTNHAINSMVESLTTYHLCVRADNSGFDAFLNAQNLGKNTAFTGAWTSNTNDLQFGIAPFSAVPANVVLDEIAIYDYVLTEGQVLALALVEAPTPVAADDIALVPESATTAIDVLANDTFAGTPALEIVSQPAGGDSVVVAGMVINYTAGAVVSDTARSFTYRITGGNTATVSVTVQNSATPPPEVDNANPFTIPGASSVVVNTMDDLVTQVNSAPAGRHILIAAGTYTGGARTFNRSGTEANPIVIRPQGARGSVTINGAQWTLANTSARLVITNLFFNDSRITLSGDHNRISRCRWRQHNGKRAVNHLTARDCRVDHCDFSEYVQNTSIKRVIEWRPEGFANGTNVRNLLDYCYFHDLTYTATNLGNGNEPLTWFAQAQNMSLGPAGSVGIIDHCLFDNHAVLGESEFISLKSGGWKVSFCTFDNVDFYTQFRTGDNGEIRSCWFENTRSNAFHLFGTDHLFIGNRFVGGLNVRICPGVATSAQVASGEVGIGAYARTANAQIIGNRMGSGRLQIGAYWSVNPNDLDTFPTLPVLNANLFENTRDSGGDAHSFDTGTLANGNPRHSGTAFNDPGAGSRFDYVIAVKLTASDVGLSAPDPLCPSGPQS